MVTQRNIERLTGLVFLALLASIIIGFAISPEMDTNREEFTDTLVDIATHPRETAAFLGVVVVGHLLTVALAGFLYLVFRPHERNLALLGSFAFVAAGAVFMGADAVTFALRSLAEDFLVARGAEGSAIFSNARALALAGEFFIGVGFTFIALAVLAYGALVIWSGAVPHALGWLSAAGGALLPFFWLIPIADGFWIVGFIGLMLILLLQLLLGGWLLVRGTQEPNGASTS